MTLGIVQGVAEWLPLSSEGMLVLVQIHLFGMTDTVTIVSQALFLHLGTLCSALVYFRHDVVSIVHNIWHGITKQHAVHVFPMFLVVSTIISGAIGALVFFLITGAGSAIEDMSTWATYAIGIALLVTGILLWKTGQLGMRTRKNVTTTDALILGVGQGLSVLPGLSRSGTTIALLLMRTFKKTEALSISFIMGIPLVAIGGVALNVRHVLFSLESVVSLIVAFAVGLISIHVLLRLVRKVSFVSVIFVFALLILISGFLL